MHAPRPRCGRGWRDDRGAAASIVLFPLFLVVTFMFVQALAWQHDRQLTAAEADRASIAVGLYGTDPATAQAEATARLEAAGMRNVSVAITRNADETVVLITGQAPGIVIGTSSTVTARSVTPTEAFRPAGEP